MAAPSLFGWKHFTITRDITGQFYVYMNETLILGFKDNQHTISKQFFFGASAGPAIDNIVVSNTVDYDAAPPKWVELPSNQATASGESFYYDLNATDYSGIDQWWIDDLEYFAIDDDGVITNIRSLEIANYTLSVGVNDTKGNILTGTFMLSVVNNPTSIPVELILVLIGIPSIVVVIIIISRIRKGV